MNADAHNRGVVHGPRGVETTTSGLQARQGGINLIVVSYISTWLLQALKQEELQLEPAP